MGVRRSHRPVAPPGGGGHPAHGGAFQKRGAYVRWRPVPAGDLPGRLLLMLPTDLAAAVRQELECYVGLRVGWEAVADGS